MVSRYVCGIDHTSNNPAKAIDQQKQRNWKPATVNRYKALLSLVFRVAVENGKVSHNPVMLVRRLREDNAVIRYLNPKTGLRQLLNPSTLSDGQLFCSPCIRECGLASSLGLNGPILRLTPTRHRFALGGRKTGPSATFR